MAKNFDAEITGTDSLDTIFQKLPNQFNRKIMMSIFRKAAAPVNRAIKSNTPVRSSKKPIRSGNKQIKGAATSGIRWPGNLKASIGNIAGKGKYPTLYVGPRMGSKYKNDGWYGKFLINGTKYIKANPFVGKAWESTKGKAEQIVEKDSGEIARKFLQKHAAK